MKYPPVAPMLPTLALPLILAVPVMLAPVPVTTIVVVPALLKLILPLIAGISILLVPLLIPDPTGTDAQDRTPEPFVCK